MRVCLRTEGPNCYSLFEYGVISVSHSRLERGLAPRGGSPSHTPLRRPHPKRGPRRSPVADGEGVGRSTWRNGPPILWPPPEKMDHQSQSRMRAHRPKVSAPLDCVRIARVHFCAAGSSLSSPRPPTPRYALSISSVTRHTSYAMHCAIRSLSPRISARRGSIAPGRPHSRLRFRQIPDRPPSGQAQIPRSERSREPVAQCKNAYGPAAAPGRCVCHHAPLREDRKAA